MPATGVETEDKAKHQVKETQFECAEDFLMIHTQCRQRWIERECGAMWLCSEEPRLLSAQKGRGAMEVRQGSLNLAAAAYPPRASLGRRDRKTNK